MFNKAIKSVAHRRRIENPEGKVSERARQVNLAVDELTREIDRDRP